MHVSDRGMKKKPIKSRYFIDNATQTESWRKRKTSASFQFRDIQKTHTRENTPRYIPFNQIYPENHKKGLMLNTMA